MGAISISIAIVLLLLSIFKVHLALNVCSGDHCNPNWLPFPNMVAALRGYNIRTGNPLQNNGDPGFLGQIFLPTKLNALGRVELERGITASELSLCRRSMTSRSFTTIDSYRNYVTESSSSGVNLQVGTETEVTAGINYKGAEGGVKKTIPTPFERAWGDSKDFKDLVKFFSKDRGMISTSMGVCTSYEVKLDRFHLPPFTHSFKKALIRLYDARNDTAHMKKNLFKLFIEEYGTHFLLRTKMGAQYVYRTKFSSRAREQLDSTILQNCNYVKGAKVFGIQIEKSQSGCTGEDENTFNRLQRADVQSSIITKGSRPTNIKIWASQEYIPVPLQFKLSPIVNLLKKEYIKNANLRGSDGKLVSAFEIHKWFIPLYFDYCASMDIADCEEKKGCGVDDKCPFDATCEGEGTIHECSEWGQWTCTVNCGQGTRQRRTRKCVGCRGTEQTRNFNCAPQKECRKPINCHMKSTPWNSEGRGRVHHLDRHHVDCGQGNTIASFQLKRNRRGKYRYEYKCCNTPYSCQSRRRHTSLSGKRGRGAVYLDRHSVRCANKEYLTSFKLQTLRNNIRYEYTCCEMQYNHMCYYGVTGWTPDGGGDDGNTVYLDRQNVSCRYGYGLSFFVLQRNWKHDHWRYSYRCCT